MRKSNVLYFTVLRYYWIVSSIQYCLFFQLEDNIQIICRANSFNQHICEKPLRNVWSFQVNTSICCLTHSLVPLHNLWVSMFRSKRTGDPIFNFNLCGGIPGGSKAFRNFIGHNIACSESITVSIDENSSWNFESVLLSLSFWWIECLFRIISGGYEN